MENALLPPGAAARLPLSPWSTLRLGSLLASGAVLGACAPMNPAVDAGYQSYANVAARPVVRPVRSISSFSDSLMCMDRLFQEAHVPPTLISSKTIPDYSGKVPVATKEMIQTSLSQMSRISNAFRYVDYEVNIAQQDTVQNLTTILLNNGQMQLQRPALYVSGAVAFVDQGVLSNHIDAGTSASRLETGISRTRNANIIGLELHLGDFKSRTLIPGMDSANEVAIGSGGQGLDLAGAIGKTGWKFNVGRDYSQGTGSAIRTLVELAMIELTGKWARVPYWQCLTLEQTHPEFQHQLRMWYDEGSPSYRQTMVQHSLMRQGYLPTGSAILPANSPVLREAIGKFQADRGLVVTGEIDYTTYDRALRNFVGMAAAGSIERIGWNALAAPTPPRQDAPRTLQISLQIENPVPDKTTFPSGTQLFLSTRVSRSAHLYCFHSSPQGNVIRLLPNQSNPSSSVSANTTIRIPDWMSPNPPFVLDTGTPGTESVICLATPDEAMERLPAAFRVPPLTLVQGVQGVQGVETQFASAFGKNGYTAQTLHWNVVPAAPAPKR